MNCGILRCMEDAASHPLALSLEEFQARYLTPAAEAMREALRGLTPEQKYAKFVGWFGEHGARSFTDGLAEFAEKDAQAIADATGMEINRCPECASCTVTMHHDSSSTRTMCKNEWHFPA